MADAEAEKQDGEEVKEAEQDGAKDGEKEEEKDSEDKAKEDGAADGEQAQPKPDQNGSLEETKDGGSNGGDDDDADSLFDDDADGEDESKPQTPALQALGLALPGSKASVSADATPAPTAGSGHATPAVTRPTAKTAVGAAATIPLLSPTEYKQMSNDILLTSSMDGQVTLFDRREGGSIGRLIPGDRAPPWCMSVSLPPPF